MPAQLDILAIESFYGGARRAMLETLVRSSRHRWTVLKLPPRKIERRLAVASTWFGEQLRQHWSGRVDILFTSEALNLPDLLRQVPALARKPIVVYFHDNQLPHVQADVEGPLDFVNLHSAQQSSEVWFNSLYHLKTCEARLQALVFRHPELSTRNPLPAVLPRFRVMVPPVDLGNLQSSLTTTSRRVLRRVFFDTRDCDIKLFNAAAAALYRRGEQIEYVTVGPVVGLGEELVRRTMSEQDDAAHAVAYSECGLFLSTKVGAMFDLHAIRALAAGCVPLVPRRGFYPEIIPPSMYGNVLYDETPDKIASRLQDMLHAGRAETDPDGLRPLLSRYETSIAVKAIDNRLDDLAAAGPTKPATV